MSKVKTIIMAPDSFKGALRADAAAAALRTGWRRIRPQDRVLEIPMSDGGEGLLKALAAPAELQEVISSDASGRKITAKIAVRGETAIIESAEANGIEHFRGRPLLPLTATTYGVGLLIRAAVKDFGCRKLVIGIGGSATTDGGAGMLQALGVKLLDRDGNVLPDGIGGGTLNQAVAAEMSGLLPELAACSIETACDVTNPLCGINGAAKIFGPQKGASPAETAELDQALRHWSTLWNDDACTPGDGAAGGLGFALRRILGGKLLSGAILVMKHNGFAGALTDADLVITGEGCSDEQTACGKLCSRVAAAAKAAGVPVLLCSGALKGDLQKLEQVFDGCFSIACGPGTLDEAIAATERNLEYIGRNIAKLFHSFKEKK